MHINIANKGAGIPDGGLFTPDQFQKRAKGELIEGQLPSRGAIEIKPTSDYVDAVAESEQVRRYLTRLGKCSLLIIAILFWWARSRPMKHAGSRTSGDE